MLTKQRKTPIQYNSIIIDINKFKGLYGMCAVQSVM